MKRMTNSATTTEIRRHVICGDATVPQPPVQQRAALAARLRLRRRSGAAEAGRGRARLALVGLAHEHLQPVARYLQPPPRVLHRVIQVVLRRAGPGGGRPGDGAASKHGHRGTHPRRGDPGAARRCPAVAPVGCKATAGGHVAWRCGARRPRQPKAAPGAAPRRATCGSHVAAVPGRCRREREGGRGRRKGGRAPAGGAEGPVPH